MKQIPSFPTLTAAARLVFRLHLLVLLVFWPVPGRSATFFLPTDGSNIVGQIQVVTADSRNTLLDIARHYDLGYEEITVANPGVSIWLPGEGTPVVVPTEFILPPRPWRGIVVNIPQRRLYYFPRHKPKERATVVTLPIGIARPGWPTPLGTTRIIGKHKDPSWFVPKSIQEEQRRLGEANFPDYFPPGPNNPMGMLALETGFAQIFIHGTNRPWGVGMRVSHGCLHLYPEHAAYLFPEVAVGTPVRIINQPVMVGDRDHLLYLSVFEPEDEYPGEQVNLIEKAMDALALYDAPVDWKRVEHVVNGKKIVPVPVSVGAPSLDEIIASTKPEKYEFEPYGIEANDAMPPDVPR
jgi:L,D-transpeptidase ErfK/SrfK